jgi:hypothetical protein
MFKIIALITAFLALTATGGCAVLAAAGAAGVGTAYYMGEGRKVYDADVKSTADAARRTIKDMNLHLISDNSDAVGGEIVARTVQDEKVTFAFKWVTPKTTELRVRVGVIGNERLTNTIYDAVDKALK